MMQESFNEEPTGDGHQEHHPLNPYSVAPLTDSDDFPSPSLGTAIADIDRVELEDAAALSTAYRAPAPPPRVWPVFGIVGLSWLSFMLCSLVMLVVAIFVVHGEFNPRLMLSADAMSEVSSSRVGLLLLVVFPQLGLVMPSLLAAYLSPVQFGKRLSLVRGHWPLWAWFAAAVTTPLIGWISSIVVGSLMEESENLKMMSDIFRGHGESGFLIPLAFLIGATPAFCEELLFRGYVQTRLNRRVGPAIGIFLSSAMFAIFHMDWIHIIAVFPLGVYLGIIAWRSGSLFPAMLGHFVNNSISVFAVVLGPENMDQEPSPEMAIFLLSVISMGMFGSVLTAVAMWRLPQPKPAMAVA
ncbi:MAG: CPBP family intramembrane metalloprotease [Planctomycetales bacterium]|nr:CPBP family intramembrane metalloprotease [Planctomycetales bacterium]